MKMITKTLRNVVVVGMFLVPFIPFIVPSGMFFPFITGKGFTFRILVEILFSLSIILAFVNEQYRPRLSRISKSVLFFIVAIFIADILGANPYKSIWSNYERMEGFVLLVHLAMYYFVASSVFQTKLEWKRFFDVSILASGLISIYGLFQIFGWVTINQGGVRVDATFGNASYLAIYLVFHIFLCLYMMIGDDVKKWKIWTYGGIAFVETIILYYSATRGAILGLIGGLVLTGLLIAWKERQNKVLRKWAYGVIGLVVLSVIGFISLRNTSFVKTSPVLSRFSTLSVAEFRTQGRYFVWPMAIKGIAERPVFGWGQENFNFVFNKYYHPEMLGQEEWFDRTHNIFLDWLIAGGIVGFLAYFSIYLSLFYYIWRKSSSFSVTEKSLLTGMISAYIFHNIFVFDNLISYIMFFSILAFINSTNTDKSVPAGSYYTKVFSKETVNYVVFPSVLIGLIFVVYFFNVPAFFANRTLIKAMSPQKEGFEKNLELFKQVYDYNSFGSTEATEQLVQSTVQVYSSQVSDVTKQNFYNLAKTKIEEKVKSVPNDARYLVFAGSFFNRFSQPDEAIKYLERALVESPNKQSIYIELASSYLNKGEVGKTSELFRKAYELSPHMKESQVIYALGAIYTRDLEVLNKMSAIISQDTIVGDDRFLKAYADIGEYNSVISILNTRIQKDPKNIQNKLSLAGVYSTIGQKQKAIDIIREIIASDPNFKAQGEQYIQQIQAS